MKFIDLFYQGEGLDEIQYLEFDGEAPFSELRLHLCEKHGFDPSVQIFLEDADDPVSDDTQIKECCTSKGLKLHFHRCRHIEVQVTYNGDDVRRRFRPGATVARVKHWAAEKKFGMSEEVAGEHMLQISGSHERPTPSTHIGTLTTCGSCAVSFDLVPDERINGASGGINE